MNWVLGEVMPWRDSCTLVVLVGRTSLTFESGNPRLEERTGV